MKRLAAFLLLFTGVLAQDFAVDPELPAEDETTPEYKKALAILEKGRFKSGQRALRKFIKKYPNSTHVADAMHRSDDNCYLGTEVLWKSGPWQKRIDVAVMGDGFTVDASGQKKQQKWAKLCVDVLWNEKAFSQYRSYFNIYFVRLASLEEGVDPQLSPDQLAKIKEKNKFRSKSRQKKTDFSTALDGKAAGPQGQVMMDRRLVYKWLKIANDDVPGVGDDRYVIAFAQFGRLGMGGGGIANVGRPDKSVTTHEFGHAFSRLLDEYANNPNDPNKMGMMGRTIRAANAYMCPREPKPEEVPWAHMLKKRIKGVGIYEGGATFKKGVYRPAASCAMNAAGAQGFCPVCREQSIKVIYEYINPIENASPSPHVDIVSNEGEEKLLTVTPMEPYKHKLEVTWYVADRAVTKGEGAGDEPFPDVDLPGVNKGGGGNDGGTIDGRPFGDRGMGGGGMPGWSGNRGMQDRSKYNNPPRGKLSRLGKRIKAKGKRDKRVPPKSIFDLGKLGPGNWEITCRVRDLTKWVIKDEKHLLEERITWDVTINARPEAAAPGK